MQKFSYVAKDRSGRNMKGELEAKDNKHALEILQSRKLLVLKLEKEGNARTGFLNIFEKKVVTDDLVILFRQLATMIDSGIPIVMALDILIDQVEKPKLKKALAEARDSVNTGSNLSDALGKHYEVFSELFVNMIRAGESSGALDVILERIAVYIEKTSALQKKVNSAMVYPAVVTGMALIITLVLIIKVVPVFKDVFSSFGAKLPTPTLMLINTSEFMQKNIVIISVAVFFLVLLVRGYIKTPKGHLAFDKMKLKIPVFGTLLRKVAISKFTRTLGTLVKSGVPILGALEVVAKTSGNIVLENAILDVRNSVRDGATIAAPLEASKIFPTMVVRMIAVGEKSGQLEKMLNKIADFYDTQVDAAVEGLTSMIEPLIIVVLGVVIGGIVMCMFLPIFKITSLINM
ncbi:MAG: type II secretion system F family protein [Candidatus Omnitrophica bacterium]|nr:type II secretion system F family protein [Candidatus Omnitrophota bacterium]